MMYRTNFIVLVLSSQRHKVVIWDDYERKNRTEISFNSVVKNVKLRKDMLVVILEQKTFIFAFMALKLIEQVDTGSNPLGLCGISTAEKAISKTIALPNPVKGSIKVLNYGKRIFLRSLVSSCREEFKQLDSSPRHGDWSD